MTPPDLTILLAEDHPLTRQSLAHQLQKHPHLHVVGQADNGQEAMLMADNLQPDLILMDIVMPVMNGILATRMIKSSHPEMKIIMLTSHQEEHKVLDAFGAGANGYCLKDIATDHLVQVIDAVAQGALWLDPEVAQYLLKALASNTHPALEKPDLPALSLSTREKEILILISEGRNNKDIAEGLCISLYTVKNHVSSIIQKLAVEDRTQAAVYAHKQGLI